MKIYTHALVLVQSKKDGAQLLEHAAELSRLLQMKITLAHICTDYREMNYVSDGLMDDAVSTEILKAKALLSELTSSVPERVDAREVVTLRRFEDLQKCINDIGVDMVIAGHRNRFMGALTSRSAEYVNHLNVDVLIKHIHD
ncbi:MULTISPECIES: universal stress protein [Gammaproteobacteria]|uniref:universal stress protein n=1 Tax=Gammaproteobacteria TaxID=1236 RepID=UPI002005F384|nr:MULTISPECIES: universal stress protein [Gammaproteobacteria]EKX4053106.1 universal stress protein [Enterobacter cloacae]MCK7301410.1 universal stress protein [Enterobacter asburiae]MDE4740207.1 universal stress protein [Klebsiella pneumoniae]MDE4766169.1 universal stress protein [Klebsiella pneumoniae]MDE4792309.1 universal stress protein [Klebsiella pneumoniae]